MGPDIINISWNGKEFLKNGVNQIRLVADPSEQSLPIADFLVNTSNSKGSVTTNVRPSTRYLIYIEEISNSNKLHAIHYVTTKKGGELDWRWILVNDWFTKYLK